MFNQYLVKIKFFFFNNANLRLFLITIVTAYVIGVLILDYDDYLLILEYMKNILIEMLSAGFIVMGILSTASIEEFGNLILLYIDMLVFNFVNLTGCEIRFYLNTYRLYIKPFEPYAFYIKILLTITILIMVRVGIPRFRYDGLPKNSWNKYIPKLIASLLIILIWWE